MLVLFETAAGYAIFKLLDEKKLTESDDLFEEFQKPKGAQQILKLKHFEKFGDTSEALAATTAAVDGKVGKVLKKALKKVLQESAEQVLTADAKLASAIKEKFKVGCLSNNSVVELMRCIRSQADNLLAGLPDKEAAAMALGLAHSLSRYKLKFSPDKVDTMIVQAICLLDELDKELNNYTMRCREWYGWHFPELGKILTDNVVFVKTIKLMGTRDNAASTDLSDILPEEVEEKVKEAAEVSMGTEISEEDILHIQILCDQVLEMTMYRSQLYDYLKSRMTAIAPNLTILLGDLVGARLISHSGSLINLAKQPASTVQIFGAEKALFRALKSQKDTPKYGLIYHSGLVATASAKNKGKMSRSLAAKASLAARVDALGEGQESTADLGVNHRAKLETRLKILEEGSLKKISGTAKAKAKFEKYQSKREVLQYPEGADVTIASGKRKFKEEEDDDSAPTPELKKKKKIKTEDVGDIDIKLEPKEEPASAKKKKKKNKVKEEKGDDESAETTNVSEVPKKKKIKVESEPEPTESGSALTGLEKKKKKKKHVQED